MKKNKIRIQQSVMTFLSILFLVWVGYYGMNKGETTTEIVEKKEIDKVVDKEDVATADQSEGEMMEIVEEVFLDAVSTTKLTTKYHTYAKEYDAKVKITESRIEKLAKKGRIVTVFVRDGQVVTAGQPIVGIEVENTAVLSESELKKELRKFESLKSKLESAQTKITKAENKDSSAQAKQQNKYDDILKEYQEVESKIASGQNKFERIVIRAAKSGVVKNLSLKMGDDITSNSSLFKIVSYDVYFDLNATDLEQWKLAADNAIVKGSFVGKDGQSIPFDLQKNSIQERVYIKHYMPIWESLKFFTDDTIDNKVSLVAVYKDIIEVSSNALGIESDGRSFVWVVNTDNHISKRYVSPIKKYGSVVLLADTSLNGVTIVVNNIDRLSEGKEINY